MFGVAKTLFLLFGCCYPVTPQNVEMLFKVTKGLKIRTDSIWMPDKQINDVPQVFICLQLCLSDFTCVAAVYDESNGVCQLASHHIDLFLTNQETDLLYIQQVAEENKVYMDCQDAFNEGERYPGVYSIQDPISRIEYNVFCEFDNEQGWSVIQRRMDGSTDFYRGWEEYVAGFGDLHGEYWLGLDIIYHLTSFNFNLSIYMEDHDGVSKMANFSLFNIDEIDYNFTVQFSDYSGDVPNSMSQPDTPFSTYDRDNDISSYNCAQNLTSGWWFESCYSDESSHLSNLNGLWYPKSEAENAPAGAGIVWKGWRGLKYSLRAVRMRVTRT